jgi:hypothetical protein
VKKSFEIVPSILRVLYSPCFFLQGIDSELVSLESIIDWEVISADDSKAGDGAPQLGQEFYSKLSQRLGERLLECGDRVPVVTGEHSSFSFSGRKTTNLMNEMIRQVSSESFPVRY